MKGKFPNFLRLLGFASWDRHHSLWWCQCICGRKVQIEKRRLGDMLNKRRPYVSCGCIRDSSSKTFFYGYRRVFFNRLKKESEHWIYKSTSKNEIIKCCFRKKYQSIQRLAYIFWHHLEDIPKGFEVSNTCNNRFCVKPSHLRMLSRHEGQKLRVITRYKNKENKNGKNK